MMLSKIWRLILRPFLAKSPPTLDRNDNLRINPGSAELKAEIAQLLLSDQSTHQKSNQGFYQINTESALGFMSTPLWSEIKQWIDCRVAATKEELLVCDEAQLKTYQLYIRTIKALPIHLIEQALKENKKQEPAQKQEPERAVVDGPPER